MRSKRGGGFQFLWKMVLWGATFNAVVVVGVDSLLLFKLPMAILWSFFDSIKVLASNMNLETYVLHQVCRLNVLHPRRHKVHKNHLRPSKASKIHLVLEHRSCHKNWHENCSNMLGTSLEWLRLVGSFLTNRRLGPLCNIQLDYPLDKVPWNNILWLFTT